MIDRLLWLSRALGWTYTAAWCASFHPQILRNYQRQSVQGVSIDFLYANVASFVAYTVYNVPMFFDPVVRGQYGARHGGKEPPIQPNDVVFPLYALLLTCFTLGQAFYYKRNKNQRLSPLVAAALGLFGGAAAIVLILVLCGTLEWLDLLEVAAGIKLVISAVKYVPQVYQNYLEQSTRAWAIGQILLDATGGVLSIAQLFLDAFRLDNPGSLSGSGLPKLLLGLLAISFDIVFIAQHYFIYRHPPDESKDDGERQRLLPNGHVQGEGNT